jgi:multiple sugar transport system substrate-binding protein
MKEVTVMTIHRQSGITRRNLAVGSAAGIAGAALARHGAGATSRIFRPSALQDQPFAGQKLVIEGPAYMAPHLPEQFLPMFAEASGAEVEWIQFPGGEEDIKYSSYLVAEDSGVDVLYAWETVIAKFGPVLLEDLTGKVNQAVLDDLVPATVTAFSWQGALYGVPFDSNMMVFMWNKELYEAAGLDPETPPQNWAEFIEFSTALTKEGQYGTLLPPDFGNYAVLVNSTGGGALDAELRTVLADSPESLLALQAMADLYATGSVDPISLSVPTSIEVGKNFRSGRFGHYLAFPNHFVLSNDPEQSQIVGKAATAIIPGVVERSGTINGFEGFAINRFSEKKDLALAFLEHTVTQPVQEYTALTWGRPPSSMTTLANPAVLEKSPQFATVSEQGQHNARRYGSPFYADLNVLYTEELIKMASGDQTVEETAAALQEKAQPIVDEYWNAIDG